MILLRVIKKRQQSRRKSRKKSFKQQKEKTKSANKLWAGRRGVGGKKRARKPFLPTEMSSFKNMIDIFSDPSGKVLDSQEPAMEWRI
jgi:hypothetical protein